MSYNTLQMFASADGLVRSFVAHHVDEVRGMLAIVLGALRLAVCKLVGRFRTFAAFFETKVRGPNSFEAVCLLEEVLPACEVSCGT